MAGEEGRRLRRGISKGFASRLATTEPLELEEGRERGRPDPGRLRLSPAHPVSAGSGEPWARVLAAPTPAISKGLSSVERWLASGSD